LKLLYSSGLIICRQWKDGTLHIGSVTLDCNDFAWAISSKPRMRAAACGCVSGMGAPSVSAMF
jgi:hypothetical protein